MQNTNIEAIEIIPYTPRWINEFQDIAKELRKHLGDLALRIDHIGSTSITGMPSKDIIDIQVTVKSLNPPEPLIESFKNAGGFKMKGDILDDLKPTDDKRPEEEWLKRYFREPEGKKRTNIHVRVNGFANQRFALLFRDFLKNDKLAFNGYSELKQNIAKTHKFDRELYLFLKEPSFQIIMSAAEKWAQITGWEPPLSDM